VTLHFYQKQNTTNTSKDFATIHSSKILLWYLGAIGRSHYLLVVNYRHALELSEVTR